MLQLPSPSTPIICVGPGTGIAPLRAAIQERIHSGSSSTPFTLTATLVPTDNTFFSENTLYFGCRSASKDYHYESDWPSHTSNNQLVLRCAFSRDNPEGVKRTYVQDLIEEDGERVWKLLREEAAILLICGSVVYRSLVRNLWCGGTDSGS